MHSFKTSKLWCTFTFMIIAVSYVNPVASATVKAFPFFILSLFCATCKNYFSAIRVKAWTSLTVSALLTLMFHGMLETKDLVMFMVCLCGTSYLSEKFEFKPKYLFYFFLLCMVPSSIYSTLRYGNVTWLPVNGVINIFGGASTKHGTALAGLLLLLPSLCYLFEQYRGVRVEFMRKTLYAILILSFYLIVFSSSRSATLSALVLLLYLFVNRNRFNSRLSVLIFIIANTSVFFMEMLQEYVVYLNDIPILADFVHVESFDRYGVTSGRAWLWGVHMHSFWESPYLMGGGREAVDFFVGDWIGWLGMEAKAGSESLYTGYIACYGLIGIGLILIQLGLYFHAVKQKNTLASAIIFCMIYSTTMGQTFVNPSTFDGILFYLLYFSYLRTSQQKVCLLR